jgi:hypothetical protein
MKMKQLLSGFAVLPLMAGIATASELAPLSDAQMDRVTAGLTIPYVLSEATTNPQTITLNFPVSDGETGLHALRTTSVVNTPFAGRAP